MTRPVPETTPESTWLAEVAKSNVPALAMAAAYDPDPSTPAPPKRSVPAEIVVAPVKLFTPLSTSEPPPVFVKL